MRGSPVDNRDVWDVKKLLEVTDHDSECGRVRPYDHVTSAPAADLNLSISLSVSS